jgi:hypothetical protein
MCGLSAKSWAVVSLTFSVPESYKELEGLCHASRF